MQAISPPTPALFLQVVSRGVGSIYQTTDRMPAPGAHLCPTGALHTTPKALCVRVHTQTRRQELTAQKAASAFPSLFR